MQLDAHLREKSLSDDAFARALGPDVSEWAVRKWRYGQRVPRPAMQRRIETATAGAVTPNDFMDAVDAAEARRRAGLAKRSTQIAGAAA